MSKPELNGEYVDGLRDALRTVAIGKTTSKSSLASCLRLVLRNESWRERVEPRTGDIFEFNSFAEFVTAPLLGGLSYDMETFKALVKGSDVEGQVEAALVGKHGGDRSKIDNVKLGEVRTQGGNSRAYLLRRLERERPDLAELVKSGEMSAHAAAIQAGYKSSPSPAAQLHKWWGKASEDERSRFLEWVLRVVVRPDWTAKTIHLVRFDDVHMSPLGDNEMSIPVRLGKVDLTECREFIDKFGQTSVKVNWGGIDA